MNEELKNIIEEMELIEAYNERGRDADRWHELNERKQEIGDELEGEETMTKTWNRPEMVELIEASMNRWNDEAIDWFTGEHFGIHQLEIGDRYEVDFVNTMHGSMTAHWYTLVLVRRIRFGQPTEYTVSMIYDGEYYPMDVDGYTWFETVESMWYC